MSIPKIAHQIWLGPHPMHPLMVTWRAQWLSLHPTWQFLLWHEGSNPDELTCGKLTLTTSVPTLLHRACHLSQRANIWRYEIIQRFGGLYLDTDMEPFKPIDDLLTETDAFVVAGDRYGRSVYETAFFGAAPRHPLLNVLVFELPTKDPTITLSMGVDYFTPIVRRFSDVLVLPPGKILFPTPSDWVPKRQYMPKPEELGVPPTPEAYAIHRWSSVWSPTGFQAITATRPKPVVKLNWRKRSR